MCHSVYRKQKLCCITLFFFMSLALITSYFVYNMASIIPLTVKFEPCLLVFYFESVEKFSWYPLPSWLKKTYFGCMYVKVAQSCLTLCDLMDCTLHGILQAKILEWVAFSFSRGSSQPRDRTQVFCTAGGFLTSWATREAQLCVCVCVYIYVCVCVCIFIYIFLVVTMILCLLVTG